MAMDGKLVVRTGPSGVIRHQCSCKGSVAGAYKGRGSQDPASHTMDCSYNTWATVFSRRHVA
jgi:hypothetical protein